MINISRLRRRVSEYGFLYVLKNVVHNRVYKPIDDALLAFMKWLLRNKELKNIIIIESHNDFDANGGAYYDYLIREGINNDYKIVWLIKNLPPKELPPNVICFNIFKPSIRKAYYICLAKLFSADDIITPKVREDQKSYFLTHGGSIWFKHISTPLPKSVDYILFSSEQFASYSSLAYGISPDSQKIIYVGFPEQDLFYSANRGKEISKICNVQNYNKVIVWMPTFRKGGGAYRNDLKVEQKLGIPLIDKTCDYNRLNDYLRERHILLIIKLHPMQYIEDIKISTMSNIIVLTKMEMKKYNLDNYRLLADSDALISDYSTAAVEYMHMDKPIAFVLEDLENYVGLLSESTTELMVGTKIYKLDDMFAFIEDVNNGIDKYKTERNCLFNRTHKYHDGYSCERLAKHMGLR